MVAVPQPPSRWFVGVDTPRFRMGPMIGYPSCVFVAQTAADLFGVQRGDLLGADRHNPLKLYRTAAMIATKWTCGVSVVTIGEVYGRDHATVLTAMRKASEETRCWASRIADEAADRWASINTYSGGSVLTSGQKYSEPGSGCTPPSRLSVSPHPSYRKETDLA